jgi:putative endonuclease
MNDYCTYIITNKLRGVLYIGVTNNLERRIIEHKNKIIEGFSTKYNLGRLVYYDVSSDIEAAILREKQLKKWDRNWKIKLIEENNPNWDDLSQDLFGI